MVTQYTWNDLSVELKSGQTDGHLYWLVDGQSASVHSTFPVLIYNSSWWPWLRTKSLACLTTAPPPRSSKPSCWQDTASTRRLSLTSSSRRRWAGCCCRHRRSNHKDDAIRPFWCCRRAAPQWVGPSGTCWLWATCCRWREASWGKPWTRPCGELSSLCCFSCWPPACSSFSCTSVWERRQKVTASFDGSSQSIQDHHKRLFNPELFNNSCPEYSFCSAVFWHGPV